MVGTEAMAAPLLHSALAREAQLLFPESQITCIDNLRDDVDAVFQLERDKVRLAVLDFVDDGLFSRGRANVGEGIVVIDRRNAKRLEGGFRIKFVIEAKLCRICGSELIDFLGGASLGS